MLDKDTQCFQLEPLVCLSLRHYKQVLRAELIQAFRKESFLLHIKEVWGGGGASLTLA